MQHVYAHFGGGCICQVVLLKLLSDSINDLLQYLTGHCHFYTQQQHVGSTVQHDNGWFSFIIL